MRPDGTVVRTCLATAAAVAAVVLQAVSFGAAAGVVGWMHPETRGKITHLAPASPKLLSVLLITELLFAAMIVVAWMAWRRRHQVGAASTIRAVVLGAPVLGVFVVVPLIAAGVAGEPLVSPALTPIAIALICGLACAVGVAEEVAYRGLVFEAAGGAAHPIAAVAISALLFAVVHVGDTWGANLNAVSVGLAVGIPFACIRVMGGSLAGLAALHATIDVFGLLRLGGVNLPPTVSTSMAVTQVAGASAIAVGYAVVTRRQARQRLTSQPPLAGPPVQ